MVGPSIPRSCQASRNARVASQARDGTLARLDAAERQARGTGRQPAFGKESRKSASGSAKETPHPGPSMRGQRATSRNPAQCRRWLSEDVLTGGALSIFADRQAILGTANYVSHREPTRRRGLTKPRNGLVSRGRPSPSQGPEYREPTCTNMAWVPKSTPKPQRKARTMQHLLGIQHRLTILCNIW